MSTTGQGGGMPGGQPTGSVATSPQPVSRPAGTAAPRPTARPGQRPAARPTARKGGTARRVRLAVARVDPWSVMKMSFLLSVAIAIVGVVVTIVLWLILSSMGLFSDVDRIIGEVLAGSDQSFQIMDYIGFGRVVSLSVVFGVIDIILLTAIATLGAFLYNICAALVGGLQLTLTDD